jgi:hypothetical protein
MVLTFVMGCADPDTAMPRCDANQRLAVVAQSVPGAAYLPCIGELPPGWEVTSFDVDDDGTRFELRSDRADQPVEVALAGSCARGDATPTAPRASGIRSYLRIDAISPSYAGTFHDVFSGGCITTEFEFERGPHIALIDELRQAVGLATRRQLGRDLEEELGITLDP